MANVSIIILNYNTSWYTINCINSIIENTFLIDYEIILVDNNSLEDDFNKLKILTFHNNVKIIRSKINLGFSGGNMFALQYSDINSDYYFFLNNDCLLMNNVCLLLYNFMKDNEKIGASTPQTYNEYLSFVPSFGYFPNLQLKLLGNSTLRFIDKKKYPKSKFIYKYPIQVPVITGSAMFVRSSIFNKIGGFDTNYFFYCEEEDLCKRFIVNGFESFLVPEAKFIHFGGKSTNESFLFTKEYYISLFYYHRKFSNFLCFQILKIIYFFENLSKFYKGNNFTKIAIFILNGAPSKVSLRHKQSING